MKHSFEDTLLCGAGCTKQTQCAPGLNLFVPETTFSYWWPLFLQHGKKQMDGHTKCKTDPTCDLNYFINNSPFKDYSPVNIVWNT